MVCDPLPLAESQRRFDTDGKALAWMEQACWPQARCAAASIARHAAGALQLPRVHAAVVRHAAGIPMRKTHLALSAWMIAAYLLASSSKGVSSLRLSNTLGLRHRTTLQLIR